MENEDTNTPVTRKCWKCGNIKPLTKEFWNKDSHDRKGFQKRCRECDHIFSRKYLTSHKEYFIRKGRERYGREKGNNRERYAKYRDQYLNRIQKSRSQAVGRFTSLLQAAKRRSEEKGWICDLDINWIIERAEKNSYQCELTGIPYTFLRRQKGQHFSPWNPSLDRIDCSKGYTKDNVRIVCTMINLALNQFGDNNLKYMCESYINYTMSKSVVCENTTIASIENTLECRE